MNKRTPKDQNKRALGRLGVLIGCVLAIAGVGLALSGYLPGLILVLIAIPFAGIYRLARLVDIRF